LLSFVLFCFFYGEKMPFPDVEGKQSICFTPPPFLLKKDTSKNACLPQVHLALVQLGIYTETAAVRLPHRHRQMCCRRQKATFWAQKHSVFFFISTPSQL
jgi:hypothetical protein